MVVVAALYFAAGRFGLTLAFSTRQISAVWLPTGIALAALLLFGYRLWPAVYLGAFLANALASEPLVVALCIAAGNTATGLAGAGALRALSFDTSLQRGRDVVALAAVAVSSTLISSTLGTSVLAFGHIVPWSGYVPAWWTWWVGDNLGILMGAPLLLTWITQPHLGWKGARLIEFGVYMAASVIVALVVFSQRMGHGPSVYPRVYFAFPLLAWAGLRMGPREAATGAAIVTAFAVWATVRGWGPFGVGPPDARLVSLDIFVASIGCTALLLGALIAERKGARTAARDNKGLLQAIIDHTRAFIYVKDLNGRYLMVNQRFLELTRTNAEAVVGKTDYDLFSVQEADRFRAMDRRVLEAGTAMTEQESVERDGRLGVYISVKCALRGKTGELQGIFGISTDITDLHEAQSRLRKAYEELEGRVRERTAELAVAIEELGQRNQEKETLLREMHHRVKNNLQVIYSLLNLQARERVEPDLLAFAESCKTRVQSMALVHEHLYRSKDLQSVPLGQYLHTLVEGLAHSRPEAAVTCEVDFHDVALPIDQAIPCGLMVNELVMNSLKHAFPVGQPGRVRVTMTNADDHIELVVSDDGVGMADGSIERAPASGFGLRLVSMLARQLEASVDVTRGPGTSTRVRFARRGPLG